MSKKPLIGLSACMMHPDPERAIFKGKRLLYLEESMGHYLLRHGAMTALIPSAPDGKDWSAELLAPFAGLVLAGGADMSPASYGEEPLHPDWSGDPIRDAYELQLTRTALVQGMPVLGICRGAQVLNVALGGSLYQDITTQVDGALIHRNWDIYDQNFHDVTLVPGSGLARLYPRNLNGTVNSVHHQGIKVLAPRLVVEAFSSKDQIAEAMRMQPDAKYPGYAFAVQWHPEFQNPGDKHLLDPGPMLQEFIAAANTFAHKRT